MAFPNELASALLGRPMRPFRATRAALSSRRILITGAGGSIGQALAVRAAALEPRALILLDNNDHGLIDASQAVAAVQSKKTVVSERLCDVRDAMRLSHVFERERPDLVLHAAALKHVHMGERHPGECVLTNLIGVRNVAEALRTHGGGRFVLISTDKAANPTSVMGACKRLAELYVRSLAEQAQGMEAVAVRFGNVFASRGSVVPIFADQIARGADVTITHPDMERYFMMLDEAVDLILQAATWERGANTATSPVMLLDMGQPLLITDLAKRMIEKLTPAGQVPSKITFTGLKEGEKLSEQLYDEHEALMPAQVDGLWRVQPLSVQQPLQNSDLVDLELSARMNSDAVVRQRVFALIARTLGQMDEAAAG